MKKRLFILIAVGCFTAFNGCKKQNEFYEIPNIAISDFIYLSNPTNFDLQVQGGWVYRQTGYKGLIIYRRYMNFDDNDFVAYERACPIHYSESCATMKVVDGLTIVCECDGKEYSLFDGSPFADNPSPSVKFYRTTFDGINTINVSN